MDPSALFKQYEADYCSKSTDASRKIAAIEGLLGEARRRKVMEVEGDLQHAEAVIKRMDMEARSLPVEQSKGLLVNVKNYKADLAGLKEQVKKTAAAMPAGDAARAELGLGGEYTSTSATNRDRMLTATQRMEQTTSLLQHGREQLAQTEGTGVAILSELQRQREGLTHAQTALQASQQELKKADASDLGTSILQDLQSQRETLVRSKDTLSSVDESVSKARRILGNMARRAMQNKIIMAGVIIFLIAGIALIIWVKVKK